MNCWQSSGSEPTAAPLELELLELELLELELLELELPELEPLELELLELELLELELLELELLELANDPAELEVVDDEDSDDAGPVPPLAPVVVPLVLPRDEPVELSPVALVPCDELPDDSPDCDRPPLVADEDALGKPGDPVPERIEVLDVFGPTEARKHPSPGRASNTRPSHAREARGGSSVRSAMPPPGSVFGSRC